MVVQGQYIANSSCIQALDINLSQRKQMKVEGDTDCTHVIFLYQTIYYTTTIISYIYFFYHKQLHSSSFLFVMIFFKFVLLSNTVLYSFGKQIQVARAT